MELSKPVAPDMAQFYHHDSPIISPDKQPEPAAKPPSIIKSAVSEEIEKSKSPNTDHTPKKLECNPRMSILQEGLKQSPNHTRLSEA